MRTHNGKNHERPFHQRKLLRLCKLATLDAKTDAAFFRPTRAIYIDDHRHRSSAWALPLIKLHRAIQKGRRDSRTQVIACRGYRAI